MNPLSLANVYQIALEVRICASLKLFLPYHRNQPFLKCSSRMCLCCTEYVKKRVSSLNAFMKFSYLDLRCSLQQKLDSEYDFYSRWNIVYKFGRGLPLWQIQLTCAHSCRLLHQSLCQPVFLYVYTKSSKFCRKATIAIVIVSASVKETVQNPRRVLGEDDEKGRDKDC